MGCRKTAYVAGGIAGVEPEKVISQFKEIESQLLDMGFQVLSPIRGKVMDTEVDSLYEVNEIVDRDLWDISRSDIIIASPSHKSIGTYMEIFYAAYVRHIPVVLIAPSDGPIARHYWTRKFATKIVPDTQAAMDYIKAWLL